MLVAEPTVFGAHNLAMVYELVRLFKKPHAVLLNKCQPGENPSEDFCIQNGITMIGRIPFDEELGRINSGGGIAAREEQEYRRLFTQVLQFIEKEAGPYETAFDS